MKSDSGSKRIVRVSPIDAAIAAGLYPVFFYFTNNYTLVNTWEHLGYFALMFLLVPAVVFLIADRVFRWSFLSKWHKYVLPFLNSFVFLFLLKVCLYAGLQKKLILVILVLASVFSFFLYRHLKKLILLQFLLAAIGLFTLVPTVIKQLSFSTEWMKQPDDIASATFKKKPNVYFIEPDGYVNFSELKRGYYNYDNSDFENFVATQGFTHYADFRSNYASTLATNSATFMMKHHYYNKGTSFSEAIDARNVIISDNTVLNVFKKNGYKTHFLAEKPYLLLNRPEMGYDETNLDYGEVGFIGTGLGTRQDLMIPLKQYLAIESTQPKFFFVQIFNPGHIGRRAGKTAGAEEERRLWLESLERGNAVLKDMISAIKENDPEALIVLMADHGGFVGMDYTNQTYEKLQDRDLIYSIFSSNLLIHWPNDDIPEYDTTLISSVNLFRILFAYLTENEEYLEHLQDDESFVIVNKGAPKGVYRYLDNEGKVVFEKL
ncbi:sulfatase-like hydrolase/transferase [Constantimarinum furrinae]|uniref:Sulfatase N-terminal domain-containing protein n=1 Tax=Constantimarinum furrinae TaxID=2562285 RepID=A0A7G8PV55_9FLAO|nr:sulfatase-like hydrolase/transferase [Constantimarinum furrinae]QNJ98221.1 hypothetical protein ALE3EI_1669 [Constantimarinum furrinae]